MHLAVTPDFTLAAATLADAVASWLASPMDSAAASNASPNTEKGFDSELSDTLALVVIGFPSHSSLGGF